MMRIEQLVADIELESIRHIEVRGVLGNPSTTISDGQSVSSDEDGADEPNELDVAIDINPRSWGQRIRSGFA